MIRMLTLLVARWRVGLLLLAVSLAACATAPVQEMSDARQAVEAAVQSGATRNAPAEISAAQAALSQAEKMLKSHQYRWARHYAQDARNKAIEAQQVSQSQGSAPAGATGTH